MNEVTLQKVVDSTREFPAISHVVTQVFQAVQDENVSASELSEIIRGDPGLTKKILRISNSSYYATTAEHTLLSEAIVKIGNRETLAIVLSSKCLDITKHWDFKINRQRFWMHSLETAIASHRIAQATGYLKPEEAFIAGLLHDIGLPLIEVYAPELNYEEFWSRLEDSNTLIEEENRFLNTNHAKVGCELLKSWGLPAIYSEAAGRHHDPLILQNIDPDPSTRLTKIVALANLMSNTPICPLKPTYGHEETCTQMLLGSLGLDRDRMDPIKLGMLLDLEKESNRLDLDIGGLDQIKTLAQEIISDMYEARGLQEEEAESTASTLMSALTSDQYMSAKAAWAAYMSAFEKLLPKKATPEEKPLVEPERSTTTGKPVSLRSDKLVAIMTVVESCVRVCLFLLGAIFLCMVYFRFSPPLFKLPWVFLHLFVLSLGAYLIVSFLTYRIQRKEQHAGEVRSKLNTTAEDDTVVDSDTRVVEQLVALIEREEGGDNES